MSRCRYQRQPGSVLHSKRVAVGIRLADCGDRSPVVVQVLGLEAGNQGIADRDVELRKEPGIVGKRHSARGRKEPDIPCHLDVRVLGIKPRDFSLLGSGI